MLEIFRLKMLGIESHGASLQIAFNKYIPRSNQKIGN